MIKVLVVDDEKLTREVLINHLPWHEYGEIELREADDGVNGYNIYMDFKPDIVISDIKMPRMNGIEMVERIIETDTYSKFIFLSGYSDKEYLKSAIKLKVVRYVEKPIDLDELKEAIHLAIEELDHEKSVTGNILPALTNEICLAMINPKSDFVTYANKLKSLGYELYKEGNYISSVISILTTHENLGVNNMDLRNDFLRLMEPVLETYKKQILISPKYTDNIVIHFCYKTETELQNYMDHLQSIKQSFQQSKLQFPYQFFIGVGASVFGIENIHTSYETAVIALKKCFFKELNSINYYSEGIQTTYVFSEHSINLSSNYMKRQEPINAIIEIKKIVREIKKYDNTHPEYIKSMFLEIILNLLRIAEDYNEVSLQEQCKISMNLLSKAPTIDTIEHILIRLLNVFSEKSKQSNVGDNITNINNYIQKNYVDFELNLNTIAENLYLTTNYLCFIYKRETGKTINQYITEVRIEKAKELLKSTNMKLYSIANKVGYQDGKYFGKVFLKVVGMKPADYRERHRDE